MPTETENHKPFMVQASDRHRDIMYYHGEFICPEDAERSAILHWKKSGEWEQAHMPVTIIVAEIRVIQRFPIQTLSS